MSTRNPTTSAPECDFCGAARPDGPGGRCVECNLQIREQAWRTYARTSGLSDEYAKVPNGTARLAFMAGWNQAAAL